MKCEIHGVDMFYVGEGSFIGQDIWICPYCDAEQDAEAQVEDYAIENGLVEDVEIDENELNKAWDDFEAADSFPF